MDCYYVAKDDDQHPYGRNKLETFGLTFNKTVFVLHSTDLNNAVFLQSILEIKSLLYF